MDYSVMDISPASVSTLQIEISPGYKDKGERAREYYEDKNGFTAPDTEYGSRMKSTITLKKDSSWKVTFTGTCHYYFCQHWGYSMDAQGRIGADIEDVENATRT